MFSGGPMLRTAIGLQRLSRRPCHPKVRPMPARSLDPRRVLQSTPELLLGIVSG